MDFLNPRGALGWYPDFDVAGAQKLRDLATVFASQGNHAHFARMGWDGMRLAFWGDWQSSDRAGNLLRTDHLETVVELARQHHLEAALTPVALQMYWALYLGVLSFWTNDKSPKQEDTLALLDQSLAMFVRWLRGGEKKTNSN